MTSSAPCASTRCKAEADRQTSIIRLPAGGRASPHGRTARFSRDGFVPAILEDGGGSYERCVRLRVSVRDVQRCVHAEYLDDSRRDHVFADRLGAGACGASLDAGDRDRFQFGHLPDRSFRLGVGDEYAGQGRRRLLYDLAFARRRGRGGPSASRFFWRRRSVSRSTWPVSPKPLWRLFPRWTCGSSGL